MSERLRGKTVFITGAASGIGRASAPLFAGEGARVVACDINADGGEEAAEAIRKDGGDAEFVPADVTDEHAVAQAFRLATGRYGPPDVLYNCAGGSTDDDAAVHELSVDTLDQVLRVDLRSVMLCSPTLTFSFADYPFATGSPEDIAYVALFLASGESRMISAQTIVADGGLGSY